MPNKFYFFIISLSIVLQLAVLARAENNMSRTDCTFNKGACTRHLETSDLIITLDINPKPLTAMSELQFSVMINQDIAPVRNATVTVDLTMPGMYMGENQVLLKKSKDNTYEGSGIIPVCPSGAKTWMADVKVNIDDIMHSANYVFELK